MRSLGLLGKMSFAKSGGMRPRGYTANLDPPQDNFPQICTTHSLGKNFRP